MHWFLETSGKSRFIFSHMPDNQEFKTLDKKEQKINVRKMEKVS